MTAPIPIGEREGARREFKPARALDRPETIARAVVAMWNAGGGEIWVGLRDDDGVAVEIEGIDDAERARRRLHDSLVDTIEPSPTDQELRIDVAGHDAGLLHLRVDGRSERWPYALLQAGGGRVYVLRVGGRIRPLTRDEIHHPRGDGRGTGSAPARLETDMKAAIENAGEATLWMGLEPAASGPRLDLGRLMESDHLVEPRSTGSRRIGRTFYSLRRRAELDNRPYLRREGGRDGASWLLARGGAYELALGESAAIRLLAPLADFTCPEEEHPRLAVLRGQSTLDPRALLEFPNSVLRLLSALLGDAGLWTAERPPAFSAALALIGIDGWYLRPGPQHPYLDPGIPDPRSLRVAPPAWRWRPQAHAGDTLTVPPLSFTAEELEGEADRCTYRLLRLVFSAFGYGEDEIPAFDPATRRFTF